MSTETLEAWRRVWRAGAPLLPTAGLEALAVALETDDPRLLQGATTTPPPLMVVQDWDVEAACLVGFCHWQDGTGKNTVHDVEEMFAKWCYDTDQILDEPAGCRWCLNWFDETPRDQMCAALLPEVRRELARRRESAA